MYCQEYIASIACSVETGGLWSVANGSFFLTLLPCSFSHFYPTWVFPQGWRAAVLQELLLRGLSTGCSLFVEQPPALSHSSTGHSVGLLSGISAPAPATPPPPPSSLSWMLTGLFLTPFFLTSHCQAPFCLFLSLSSRNTTGMAGGLRGTLWRGPYEQTVPASPHWGRCHHVTNSQHGWCWFLVS